MKRYFILYIFFLGLFSCSKKEDIAPGERPEERLTEELAMYQEKLVNAAYGWKAFLYPAGGGGYTFYFNFTEKGRVIMYSDFNANTLSQTKESSYRLKPTRVPSLLFDTYNYIHLLADPDASKNGGTSGWGKYSDFEFAFERSTEDSILLSGNFLQSPMLMIKATAEEAEGFENGSFSQYINQIRSYVEAHPYLFFKPNGEDLIVQFSPNMQTRNVDLAWLEDGQIHRLTAPFALSSDGLEVYGYGELAIKKVTFDGQFQLHLIDGTSLDIEESDQPILPLHILMGATYQSLIVPVGLSEGSSASFQEMYTTLKQVLTTGTYFILKDLYFTFNSVTNTFTIRSSMPQTEGGTIFPSTFNFDYTKDENGAYHFTYIEAAEYGSYTEDRFRPLIDKLTTGTYTLDYYTSQDGSLLGKFSSSDDNNFYFTGKLQ